MRHSRPTSEPGLMVMRPEYESSGRRSKFVRGSFTACALARPFELEVPDVIQSNRGDPKRDMRRVLPMVPEDRERIAGGRRPVRIRWRPQGRLAHGPAVDLQTEAANQRHIVQRRQFHKEIMRMLPIMQRLVPRYRIRQTGARAGIPLCQR